MLSHGRDTSFNNRFLGNIHTIATTFNAMFLMCPHKKERKKGKGHFYFLFLKMVVLIYIYIFSF